MTPTERVRPWLVASCMAIVSVACSPAPADDASGPDKGTSAPTGAQAGAPVAEVKAQAPTKVVSSPGAKPVGDAIVQQVTAQRAKQDGQDWGAIKGFTSVGEVAFRGSTAYAYRMTLQTGAKARVQQEFLVLSVPQAGARVTVGVKLGQAYTPPSGYEEHIEVGPVESFRVEHDTLRAQVSVTTGGADFATCDDCFGKSKYPEVRKSYTLVCKGASTCALVPLALEVLEPAYVVNEEGRRMPAKSEDPDAYLLEWTQIDAGHLEWSMTSGSPPAAVAGLSQRAKIEGFVGDPEFGYGPEQH